MNSELPPHSLFWVQVQNYFLAPESFTLLPTRTVPIRMTNNSMGLCALCFVHWKKYLWENTKLHCSWFFSPLPALPAQGQVHSTGDGTASPGKCHHSASSVVVGITHFRNYKAALWRQMSWRTSESVALL